MESGKMYCNVKKRRGMEEEEGGGGGEKGNNTINTFTDFIDDY
tara:strand:- start:303 stop:431 length:129 start_codon:yes stop_codon:yes gene_type:complete